MDSRSKEIGLCETMLGKEYLSINFVDTLPRNVCCSLENQLNVSITELISKESTYSGSSPAEDANNEGELNTISLWRENQIVLSPRSDHNSDEISCC